MFGQFIKAKRQQAGISQDTVALKLGFEHRSTVSRLEAGKMQWKVNHLDKLAEIFNTTASELLKEYENQ